MILRLLIAGLLCSLASLTAQVASLAVSTWSLGFPVTTVGTASAPLDLSLTNTGPQPVALQGITISRFEFRVISNTCGLNILAPGSSCTFSIVFKPRVSGDRSAVLQVFAAPNGVYLSNPSNFNVANVALTGTGSGAAAVAALTYSVRDISGFADAKFVGISINSSGIVVGSAYYPQPAGCAMPWYTRAITLNPRDGALQVLGPLPGASLPDNPGCLPSTEGQGINSAGVVVGRGDGPGGSLRAFVYSNGVLQDANSLITDGSDATVDIIGAPYGQGMINSAGDVVAWSYRWNDALLVRNGSATRLRFGSEPLTGLNLIGFGPENVFAPRGYGLNDSGQILVSTELGPCLSYGGCPGFVGRFAIWRNGTLSSLAHGTAGGGFLNSLGQAAVGFNNTHVALGEVNYRIDEDLACSEPLGITSSLNVLAGSSCAPYDHSVLIWDADRGLREVGSLASLSSTERIGAHSASPTINDAGQILTEKYNSADGSFHFVVLTPVITTSAGSNVKVQSGQATLTFSTVSQLGTTTVEPLEPSSIGDVPGGFAVSGALALQISSTAQFTGPVTLALVVPGPITAEEFAALRVLHNESGTLVDVTASTPLRDYPSRTIYATTTNFSPFYLVRSGSRVSPSFDQARSYKAGSTIPIKLQLLDGSGVNISSASIRLRSRAVNRIGGNTLVAVTDAGNSNPDSEFRYDSSISTSGGYLYNLSTKGMAPGRYSLSFWVGTQRAFFHTISFELR